MTAVATVSVGIWFCPGYAVAGSVPSWDVTTSCRGAAEAGFVQDTAANLKRCHDSEQRTREQLDKDWSTFPAADKSQMRQGGNVLANIYRACDLP